MTRKTFGEKMNEENKKFKAMSKKEKEEYFEKKFPGLLQRLKPAIQTINEMQPTIQTVIHTINDIQPEIQLAIQTIKEIQPLIPEIPQLEPQIELEAPIDITTEIGREQINIMRKQGEFAKKSLETAEKSLFNSKLAIIASIIVPIIVAIIIQFLEMNP